MINPDAKIINLTDEQKTVLLDALGYGVDEDGYVVELEAPDGTQNKRVKDRYTNEDVKLENASVLPGSTIIIDTNAFSISEYFEEFGQKDCVR